MVLTPYMGTDARLTIIGDERGWSQGSIPMRGRHHVDELGSG